MAVPAVLFVVFNRLETVKKTLEAIRKAAPSQLFIAADGPRENAAGEEEKCRSVRSYIVENIDWECEVRTRFLEKNLGCRKAVSSAVDWFFSEVEEGIILEDDCLPGKDFFRYAEAALEFYRDDERIMHINGSLFGAPEVPSGECAFFYRYAHIWGWASWRRAWKYYDADVRDFDPAKMYAVFHDDRKQAARWNEILQNVIADKPGFNTWDFQWTYAVMSQNKWCISPVRNLISNIGAEQSTHDMDGVSNVLGLQAETLPEKLDFPEKRYPFSLKIEKETYKIFYHKKNILIRIFQKIQKKIFKKK